MGGSTSTTAFDAAVMMYIWYLPDKSKYHVPGVPKHMKRFESLIIFDSIKIICCLLFLLVNVFYIEIIKCHIST